MPSRALDRTAAVLVGLQALGLVVLAVWEIVALVSGDNASPASAVALIVLTLVGAAILAAFAAAIARGRSWGRSGGIVTQLLILAVALGAATGVYGDGLTALAIAAPGILTLVVIILAARAGAPPREG